MNTHLQCAEIVTTLVGQARVVVATTVNSACGSVACQVGRVVSIIVAGVLLVMLPGLPERCPVPVVGVQWGVSYICL